MLVAFSALTQMSADGMPWAGGVTSINGAAGSYTITPATFGAAPVGDVNSSGTVTKVNGGTVPASAAVLSTDSSGKPIASPVITDDGSTLNFTGRNVSVGARVLKPVVGVNRESNGLNWVFEGDSLTAGSGLVKSSANTPACQTSLADATCLDWPSQFLLMSTAKGRYLSKYVIASPGYTLAQIQTRYAAQVHPISPAVTSVAGVLSVWIGANDLSGTAQATFITGLGSYITTAKSDGWTVMLWSIQRRGDMNDPTNVNELKRQSWNQWIRAQANSGNVDYLVDVDRLMVTPYDSVTFQSDHIHETAAGQYLLAKAANGVVWTDGLTAPVSAPDSAVGSGAGNWFADPYGPAALTSGTNNTVAGWYAGRVLVDGTQNTLYGYNAGIALTSGSKSTCIGFATCRVMTTQTGSTGIGWGALYTTTGANNTAIGYNAGTSGSVFANGTFVGYLAGASNDGGDNTAMGSSALAASSTAYSNVAIGSRALSNGTGSQIVAVGKDAATVTTGNNNTCLGYHACFSLVAGYGDVAIGQSADLGASTNNAVQLGTGTNSTNNTLQYMNVKLADTSGYLYTLVATPATAAAACTPGQIAVDAGFFYNCVATNSWRRVATAAW
jgi:hypothetical protein